MKKLIYLLAPALLAANASQAQYNTLWIPDTLSGTNFNLTIRDTFRQILPGQQTITGGINGSIWGPTLIFKQGDTVHMHVTNNLADTTTIHWHGFHLPAVMDGGPHQTIPPGTTWNPYWKVTNNAAMYWYHPHMHTMTEEQINMGLGGLIIVRDNTESALPLPRTYGIDDIPLILTDRRFDNTNQFVLSHYGDTMTTNFTIHAQYTVPAQVVRFRLLNVATERFYNVGFSDNRTFYVVGSDGGLLDTPVGVTRYTMGPGERIEILANFNGQNGQSIDIMAFNSTFNNAIPGGEPVNFPVADFQNALGQRDFMILHLNVGPQTANAITSIPTILTTNNFWNIATATVNRSLSFNTVQGPPYPPGASLIDNTPFAMNVINKNVDLGATEIWTLNNTTNVAHPFHIHDVEFHIIDRNGSPAPAYEQGWKDILWVPSNSTAKFIAKFEDYCDSVYPYMYHCHIAFHEDAGMMGQFTVGCTPAGVKDVSQARGIDIYPNPASGKLYVSFRDNSGIYELDVIDIRGKTLYKYPMPQQGAGIDISKLTVGIYIVRVQDMNGNITLQKFVKE